MNNDVYTWVPEVGSRVKDKASGKLVKTVVFYVTKPPRRKANLAITDFVLDPSWVRAVQLEGVKRPVTIAMIRRDWEAA